MQHNLLTGLELLWRRLRPGKFGAQQDQLWNRLLGRGTGKETKGHLNVAWLGRVPLGLLMLLLGLRLTRRLGQ